MKSHIELQTARITNCVHAAEVNEDGPLWGLVFDMGEDEEPGFNSPDVMTRFVLDGWEWPLIRESVNCRVLA